jgi:hypothetical protein
MLESFNAHRHSGERLPVEIEVACCPHVGKAIPIRSDAEVMQPAGLPADFSRDDLVR